MSPLNTVPLVLICGAAVFASGCARIPQQGGTDSTFSGIPKQSSTHETERKDVPGTLREQLIIAAFRLDAVEVKRCLDEGARANARFEKYDENVFRDKWFHGYSHVASPNWTALLSVASSNREPDPPSEFPNTTEGIKQAEKECAKIPRHVLIEREKRRVKIATMLLKAGADIDAQDGYGSTALSEAVYNKYESLALFLIRNGANLNTKTGIYIDGTGDISPVHRATDNPRLLKALLEHKADPNVQDDTGGTPLHWAARDKQVESVKLLLKVGANVSLKDKANHSPLWWVEWSREKVLLNGNRQKSTSEEIEQSTKYLNSMRSPAEKKIANLLRRAGAE